MGVQPDTGQRCSDCGLYEVHRYDVPTENPEEPQSFEICTNCDKGCGPYEDALNAYLDFYGGLSSAD